MTSFLSSGQLRASWAVLAVLLIVTGFGNAQRKLNRNVPVGADVKHGITFDCPEEFGYYPHPTDCTQYYVCVFGGALLESCTGGLMYSHELQTCDWPRNVGCDSLQEVTITASSPSPSRSTEQRVRYSITSPTPPPPPPQPAAVVTSRGQSRQLQHHTQEIISKQQQQQQLYTDSDDILPPADEIENDRQQRVYRGQPSTVGQVQRDRDGLRHTNAIPDFLNCKIECAETNIGLCATQLKDKFETSSRGEKIGVISFGTQQQPIQQYRNITGHLDDILTNKLTEKRRRKRQIRRRLPTLDLTAIGDTSISWQTRHVPTSNLQLNTHKNHRPNPLIIQSPPNHRANVRYKPVNYTIVAPNTQFNPFSPSPIEYKPKVQQPQLNPYIAPKVPQPSTMFQYFNANKPKPQNENYAYFNLGSTATPSPASYTAVTVKNAEVFYPNPEVIENDNKFRPMANPPRYVQYLNHRVPLVDDNHNHKTHSHVQVNSSPKIVYEPVTQKAEEIAVADEPSEEESEESNSEETSGKYEEDKGSEENMDDKEDIRADFPPPPPFFYNTANKYENIENPFAAPDFDFDQFIAKLKNGHDEHVHPKQTSKGSKINQITAPVSTTSTPLRTAGLENIYLRTPVTFSTPVQDSITKKKPVIVNIPKSHKNNLKPPKDDDYYYYDDDYDSPSTPSIKDKLKSHVVSEENFVQNNNKSYRPSYAKVPSTSNQYVTNSIKPPTLRPSEQFRHPSTAMPSNHKYETDRPSQSNSSIKHGPIIEYEYYDDYDYNLPKESNKQKTTYKENPSSKIPKQPSRPKEASYITQITHPYKTHTTERYSTTTPKLTYTVRQRPKTIAPETVTRTTNYGHHRGKMTTFRPYNDPDNNESRYSRHKLAHSNSSRIEEVSVTAQTPTIAVVQSTPTARTLYNGSQHYDPSQYDPYYALYEDDVELYRDVDYSQQYNNRGQQVSAQQTYRGTPAPVQIHATVEDEPSSQRNSAYIQSGYSTQPQDVYQHSTIQDYNEDNYNVQQVDDQSNYRQSGRQPSKGDRNELNYYVEPSPKSTKHVRTTTTTTTTTSRPISVQKQSVVPSRSPSFTATANQTRPQSIIITLSATPGKNPPVLPTATDSGTEHTNTSTPDSAHSRFISLTTGFALNRNRDRQTANLPVTYKPKYVHRQTPSDNISDSRTAVVNRPAPFSLTKLPTADMKSVTFQLTSRIVSSRDEVSQESRESLVPAPRTTEPSYKREVFSNSRSSGNNLRVANATRHIVPTTYAPPKIDLSLLLPKQNATVASASEHTTTHKAYNYYETEKSTASNQNYGSSETFTSSPKTQQYFVPVRKSASNIANFERKEPKIISRIHFGLSDTYSSSERQDRRVPSSTENLFNERSNSNSQKTKYRTNYDSIEQSSTNRYTASTYRYATSSERPTTSTYAPTTTTFKSLFNFDSQPKPTRFGWTTTSPANYVTSRYNQFKYEPSSVEFVPSTSTVSTTVYPTGFFKPFVFNFSAFDRTTKSATHTTPYTSTTYPTSTTTTTTTTTTTRPTTTTTTRPTTTTTTRPTTTTTTTTTTRPTTTTTTTRPTTTTTPRPRTQTSTTTRPYEPYNTVKHISPSSVGYVMPQNLNDRYKYVTENLDKDTYVDPDSVRSELFTNRNAKPFRATVELPSVPEILATQEHVTKKDSDVVPSYKPRAGASLSAASLPTLLDLTNKTVADPSRNLSVPARASRVNTAIKSLIAFGGTRRNSHNTKCNENQTVPDSKCNEIQKQRTSTRGRGSAHYASAGAGAVDTVQVNRGTPASRSRPTLKPSTSIVSKASEFVDIYRYPAYRPDAIYPQPQVDKQAAKCRKDVCLLPDCSCGGKEIPADLPVEQVPQIVLLTFDDSVNDLNKGLYSDLFEKGRTNPNGCPISATFYVSHEWTDYSQVQNLYSDGHEIASHTVSHSFGEQFSQKKWNREVAGQREILAAYGGVHLEDVRGMRAPFLSVGGNKMFKMLYDSNFTYDSSMPVYENRPPSWPYTLDYKLFHDCMIPPCPTRSYPGVWEVPMVMWQDLNGGRCSMGDACSNPPESDGVYKMLTKNFERHYMTNRAPFGLFYHAAWFTQPHHKEGFIRFLDYLVSKDDVFLVTNWQAIQWVRDPTPLNRINNFQPFQCNYPDRPKRCNNPKVCNLWHKSGVRYMKTCQPCPDIYPWTGKTGIRSSRIDNDIED